MLIKVVAIFDEGMRAGNVIAIGSVVGAQTAKHEFALLFLEIDTSKLCDSKLLADRLPLSKRLFRLMIGSINHFWRNAKPRPHFHAEMSKVVMTAKDSSNHH